MAAHEGGFQQSAAIRMVAAHLLLKIPIGGQVHQSSGAFASEW